MRAEMPFTSKPIMDVGRKKSRVMCRISESATRYILCAIMHVTGYTELSRVHFLCAQLFLHFRIGIVCRSSTLKSKKIPTTAYTFSSYTRNKAEGAYSVDFDGSNHNGESMEQFLETVIKWRCRPDSLILSQ